MPELIAWADLAISSGGSTCWELGFMRIPHMVIILAQNQQLVAEGIAKAGMGLNLGWHNNIDSSWMAQEIYSLIFSFEKRVVMLKKAEAKIDGEGVSRVIKPINAVSISIRRVTESDCELIWRWVNDKETREASFAEHYISWNEHIQWFDSVMKRDDILFYIAENNRKGPVGQLRFELKSKETMVSLSICP
ncbi:MAG TPA: hypothetical protein DDW17_05775 [Deltaproteobacteria bacterium]|nr:hypothetical protein [Deltaproteobacteria bacterium]